MPATGRPEHHAGPLVEVRSLGPAALHALAAGDTASASRLAGLPLPAGFVSEDWIGIWRRRSGQVRADPPSAGWVTGAVWDATAGRVVGRAGFHGPPDPTGTAEVGYAILPELQRRGYGRAALQVLLRRARAEPGVRVVRACVRPDNLASRAIVERFGFVVVGEQQDPDDGRELVYEVAVSGPAPRRIADVGSWTPQRT